MKDWRIHQKLAFAFTLITLLPILLLTLVSLYSVFNKLNYEMERKVLISLKVASNTYQELIERMQKQALIIAQMQEIQEALVNNDKISLMQFCEIKRSQLGTLFLEIANKDAEIIARSFETDSKNPLLGQTNIDCRSHLSVSGDSLLIYGLTHSANVFIKKENEELVIRGVAPVQTYGDAFGVVVIGYLINNILAKEIADITDTEVILYLQKELIASSYDDSNIESGLKLTSDILEKTMNDTFYVMERNIENIASAVGYTPLLNPNTQSTIGLISVVVSREYLEKVKATYRIQAILIAILMVILAYIFGYIYAKQFTIPIHNLLKATTTVANGKFDEHIDIISKDEIGQLGKSFNIMAEKLKRMLKEVIEKERMSQELETAWQIQKQLLPSESPLIDDLDIYGISLPATEVGGDYFDYFHLNEKEFGLVIADVAGKGVPASLLMSNLQASLQTLVSAQIPLVDSTEMINRVVCHNSSSDKFITFFYAQVNIETGLMQFVNAGHNPPYIIHKDASLERLKIGGTVLGLYESCTYEVGTIQLQVGDLLYCFTDGISEAQGSLGIEYGEERLEKLLIQNRDKTAEDLAAIIQKDISIYIGNAPQYDDITHIVLRFKG